MGGQGTRKGLPLPYEVIASNRVWEGQPLAGALVSFMLTPN